MKKPLGVVLAGGKSSRLGRDKASIPFEGTDLLKRTVRLAQQVCSKVWVVGRNPAAHGVQAGWMLDDIPGQGPIGGVLTALSRLDHSCLILTCDLPLLNLAVLEMLLQGWRERDKKSLMTTYLHERTGYIEPLVAVYEPEAVPRLQDGLDQGIRKLSRVLPASVRHHIPCPDTFAKSFFNINYPADLMLLRELEQMRREAIQTAERKVRAQG